MKNLIILLFLTTSFSACKDNTVKKQNPSKEKEVLSAEKSSPNLEIGCYSYNSNNSNIIFKITSLKGDVKGELTYELYEKDKNSGTFNGELNGDKLLGTYTFISEGVESKRELAFLIKENLLIEGNGTLKENGTTFVDTSNISYTSEMPLTKRVCK